METADWLVNLLSTTTGAILVCLLLILRECKAAFVEYLNHKKGMHQRRETDLHIDQTNDSLKDIRNGVNKILSRWG